MSVLEYPEAISSKEVQIWNNAAFDNGRELEDSAAVKLSWSITNPSISSIHLSQSLESDSTKENQAPSMADSPHSIKSLASINPLQTNTSITNTQHSMSIPISKVTSLGIKKDNLPDERNIDSEIEEIEKEINKLSSRLEDLRLEKANMNAKAMEKRGRIVAAKFMELPKQSTQTTEKQSKFEDSISLSAKMKTPRRGLSLGPAEIMRGERRGISLVPAEIYSATKMKQFSKEIRTPIQPSSSRRKSCYWKLQDIDELRITKERGKSASLSPKSRSKTISKSQAPRQPATAIGSRKTVKKEEGATSSIQPKNLFGKDGEKSAKKPMTFGRVVGSRYTQGSSSMKEVRNRSLLDKEEDNKKSERKRASLNDTKPQEGEQPVVRRENRVKKRWEIPSEVTIQKGVPKIKTLRFENEGPRDSGPAKRVSELIGRKSYFSVDFAEGDGVEEEDEESVCRALDFAEDDINKELLRIKVLKCVDESPRDSGAAKRVAELVGKKSFFNDDDHEMPVFSFEEEGDNEEN